MNDELPPLPPLPPDFPLEADGDAEATAPTPDVEETAPEEEYLPEPEEEYVPDAEPLEPLPRASVPSSPQRGRWRFLWWRFGGMGFLVSLMVHIAIVVVAVLWVIGRQEVEEEPRTFSTGAGGGEYGVSVKAEQRTSARKSIRTVRPPSRLVVKGPTTSGLTLPDLGVSSLQSAMASASSSSSALSKGAGGGFGGGSGGGRGIGVGGGKNYVAKFVLGARIEAQKIAVYLDNSQSMVPYLENVKQEIYSQFPDADVFAFFGAHVYVVGSEIYMSPEYTGTPKTFIGPKRSYRYSTDTSTLSPRGRELFEANELALESGSLGTWMEFMFREKYDALVVFSDFQDSVLQYDKNDLPVKLASRTTAQLAWERRWQATFRQKGAPKLYLFSIQMEPSPLLIQCASNSKGTVKMLPNLRK
ncbi:MAG: hypothetical protein LBV28_05445 [Puniceicoccales bacterium]|jgi:hypothetical protein|nr:hypothetical protein [Puniceicoccales bacterium]